MKFRKLLLLIFLNYLGSIDNNMQLFGPVMRAVTIAEFNLTNCLKIYQFTYIY